VLTDAQGRHDARAGAAPAGAHASAGFAWPVRVYYEDTDTGGVVYYANHLRFFERCRTEWLRALGFGQRELAERDGAMFVVAGAQIDYLRPARLDDELRIEARLVGRHASYIEFAQCAWRGSELLSRGRVKVACVDARTLKPRRLPAALTGALQAGAAAAPAA
jgi:acyl-CoA thioester hydrolase